jgi:hypothetical protein
MSTYPSFPLTVSLLALGLTLIVSPATWMILSGFFHTTPTQLSDAALSASPTARHIILTIYVQDFR